MTIVDTHAHLYSEDEVHYPMIEKPLRPPPGTGTVEHLRREMEASGVTGVVAIQTGSAYRWDNRFVADAVKGNPGWMTGVCTLDPEDERSPDILSHLVGEYGIRGLRSVPAEGHIFHPGVARLWERAAQAGIVVNVLIGPDLAEELGRMLERFPHLPVVLDHCLNLRASDPGTLPKVLDLARFPNLHAKLTFIPAGSSEGYPCRDMFEATRRVIGAFGPDRCVWGSDFPCELWCPKVAYAQHLCIFTDELGLSEGEKEAILGGTAVRLWFGG